MCDRCEIMRDSPIAASSPFKGGILTSNSHNRAKNKGRRSISLFDVSAIDEPRDPPKNSESNETLTSICKDSGYVQSEESCLDEEEEDVKRENKGSVKDLVEELKFKDALISELQESNRGLRLRCADAENKIWRLRIKCESHCGCCELKNHSDDGKLSPDTKKKTRTSQDAKNGDIIMDFSELNKQSQASNKVDFVRARGKQPKDCWKSLLIDKPKKLLTCSISSDSTSATHTKNCFNRSYQSQGAITNNIIEDLSLSKVERWKRELEEIEKASGNTGKMKPSIASWKDKTNSIRSSLPVECTMSPESSFETFDKSWKPTEYSKFLEKRSEPSIIDSSQQRNSFGNMKSSRRESKSPISHSGSCDYSRDCKRKETHMTVSSDHGDGLGRSRENELLNPSAPICTPHRTLVLDEKNCRKMSNCLGCQISVVPTHFLVIPNCCCRTTNNGFCQSHPKNSSQHGEQHTSHNCTYKPDRLSDCQTCSYECSHMVTPIKSSNVSRNLIENEKCEAYDSPKLFSSAIIPLAKKVCDNDELTRKIQEGVGKIVSDSKAEMDSLSFKPWPPTDFAKMSRLMQCLAETSHYAHQLAVGSTKIYRRFQTLS